MCPSHHMTIITAKHVAEPSLELSLFSGWGGHWEWKEYAMRQRYRNGSVLACRLLLDLSCKLASCSMQPHLFIVTHQAQFLAPYMQKKKKKPTSRDKTLTTSFGQILFSRQLHKQSPAHHQEVKTRLLKHTCVYWSRLQERENHQLAVIQKTKTRLANVKLCRGKGQSRKEK